MTLRWRIPPEKLWGYSFIRSSGRSMPTRAISSTTRVCSSGFEISGLWTRTASAICAPMVMVGSREVIGSWNTMENSLPRSFRMSRSR